MKIQHVRIGLTLVSMLLLGRMAWAQSSQPQAFLAKQIWSGDSEPVENGVLFVSDGKIVSVGPRDSLSIPPNAIVHDLGSRCIIPGLIAAHSNLAGSQAEERTLTPQIRAIDGFDFFADREALLESGITTVRLSPASNRLIPGVGGVVQLAGEDTFERVLTEHDALEIVLTEAARNPPRIYEPPVGPVSEDRPLETTRPQLATLTATLAGLRQIFREAKSDQTYVSTDQDPVISEVARLIQDKKTIRINAKTVPEIRGAVSLAKEFDLAIVLAGCVDLKPFHSVFSSWKPYVQGVVLPSTTPGQITNPSLDEIEKNRDPIESARELLDAGIPVCIQTTTDGDLPNLMFLAGRLMQDNLTLAEAVAALTSTPAAILGVEDRVGVLAAGRNADFVVLDGAPFKLHSRIQATYVSGRPVFERAHQPQTTVVRAERVYLGDGQYLDQASVVVKGSTFRGVGPSVSSPADADVRAYDGAVIVPGFVDLGSGLGLGGPLQGSITLSTKLGEQLYPDDPAIDYARRNGVTTVLLGTGASGKASPVVAFKLGPDTRVLGDPVAIRFSMTGDTAVAETANEKLLKAGKAYADAWTKYEKDLKEYEAKVAAQAAEKKSAAATSKTNAAKKDATAKPAEKKDAEKKESGDKKKPEGKDGDEKKDEKKEVEKKEGSEGKEEKKKKKEPLPDPISGTWEGSISVERVPPQLRAFKLELVLDEEGVVTGTVEFFRREIDIVSGSFDRQSKQLSVVFEQRGNEVEIVGQLDDAGKLSGTIELGRMGAVELTAERTVDKSKKPEPEVESDPPEKKEPEKKEPEKKPGADRDKKGGEKAEKDKKESEKDAKDDKKEPAETEPKEKQQPELKPPKKPRQSESLEPYRDLFAGKIPAMVEARTLSSIKAAAELFRKKYQLRTMIIGGDELVRQPGALDGYEVSVAAGPQLSIAREKQPKANLPQVLANEQIPFGFQTGGTTGVGQLPAAVQFSVSQGLAVSDAIRALTQTPANLLSEDLKLGKIQAGHDADMVVLSGDPFEFSTRVLAVMVDGVWVYQREEQE
jgi:imidazolonepropionase-like amidohydrolase